jgi:glucosyl-dolichyl phosphate glucuronosyltransferase
MRSAPTSNSWRSRGTVDVTGAYGTLGRVTSISVIVPTYKRPDLAIRCVSSLQDQTLGAFELILVDNAADATLHQQVLNFNTGVRVPVTYLAEPRPGAHTARHAGARAATGTVLVFTDDDVTFEPGWLAAYATAFDVHPQMAAAGGTVRPRWEAEPPDWLRRFMSDRAMFPQLSLMEFSNEFQLAPDGIFFSLNMAIPRDVFFELGGFNPDAYGDTWLGDGETGLNRKLWARGASIGFVPDARVYHHIPQRRLTLEHLRQREANDGACDMYAHFHHRSMDAGSLVLQAARICVASARDWLAALVLRGRTDPRSLRVQLRAARSQGQVRYIARLLVDPARRALVAKQDWLNA